jgi:hypothetical protein
MFDEYLGNSKSDSQVSRKRVQLKSLLLPIAIWIAVPLVLFALPADFPSLYPFVIMMVPVTGIGLVLAFVIVLVRRGWDPNPIMAILLVIVVGAPGLATIYKTGGQFHLLTNGSRYERIIDRIKSTDDAQERERICGDDCFVLSSDPLRVSFHYSHFYLSWTDLVYDQSHTIADLNISECHRLSSYLFSAERLSGDWYFGHFGD